MSHAEVSDALQLRDACVPCPVCGRLICVRIWRHDAGWNELSQPQSCLLGETHVCNAESKQGPLSMTAGTEVPQLVAGADHDPAPSARHWSTLFP